MAKKVADLLEQLRKQDRTQLAQDQADATRTTHTKKVTSDSEAQRLQEALEQSQTSEREARELLAQAQDRADAFMAQAKAELEARAKAPDSEVQRLQEALEQSQASDREARELLAQAQDRADALLAQTKTAHTAQLAKMAQMAQTKIAELEARTKVSDPEVNRLQEALKQSQASDREARELLAQPQERSAFMAQAKTGETEAMPSKKVAKLETRVAEMSEFSPGEAGDLVAQSPAGNAAQTRKIRSLVNFWRHSSEGGSRHRSSSSKSLGNKGWSPLH